MARRRPPRPPAPPSGFTLVELMITIAVLAITLAVAVPSFTQMTRRNALTAGANEILAAIQTARIEAVRRNQRVSLCASSDGATCNSDDWSRMIVLVDADNEVVADIQAVQTRLVVQGSSNVSDADDRIRFGADGIVRIGATPLRSGAVSLCSDRLPESENTRDVRINVSRVWVEARNGTAACTAFND
jgi:type IV fimbrial biogenesis protein FimT